MLRTLWVLTLFFQLTAQAQVADTVVHLPEFSLFEKRIFYFNAGNNPQRIDSSLIKHNPSASLGDLLLFNSTLNVDAYGVGSSSISARGMGPKRTPVIWNGFNLQSINGHDVDASSIQGFMADRIYIETGSHSALFGSGASGGIVYLENTPADTHKPLSQLSVGTGSYGKQLAAATVNFGKASYRGDVRVMYDEAVNDFRYKAEYLKTNSSKGTTDTIKLDTKQLNAAKQQLGLMSNHYLQLSAHQHIKVNLWYHTTDRQIAPTVVNVADGKSNDATQLDHNYRTALSWGLRKQKVELAARAGYFASETDYAKPSSKTATLSKSQSVISEAEATWQAESYLSFNAGLHHTFEEAESSSFADKKQRQRKAAFASARLTVPYTRTRLTLNGRIEHTDDNTPQTYTIGLEQPLVKQLYAIAKMGTSYRVPTFNDLYWKSATAVGNPDLKPEEGRNLEGGLAYKGAYKKARFEAGATLFGMEMKNWMSWGKNADNVSIVLNQDSASIKGAEANLAFTLGNTTQSIGLRGTYTYLDARDPKTDNRLAYVPMNKSSVSLSGQLNGLSGILTRTETDKVAVNASNSAYLKGYVLYNLSVLKELGIGAYGTSVGVQVNNLTNTQYQTRQHYPMMGRHVLITANIKL